MFTTIFIFLLTNIAILLYSCLWKVKVYLIHFYKTRRGDYPVKDFVQQLSKKSRAKIWRYVELLEKYGPNLLRPYADSVEDKVRELRIRVVEGNIRILYFFFMGRNAVLLHALKKKTSELLHIPANFYHLFRKTFTTHSGNFYHQIRG